MTETVWWSIASIVAKTGSLLALAGVSGGSYIFVLAARAGISSKQSVLLRYLLYCAVLGMASSLLFFIFQVGAFNESGLGGMFDPVMGSILGKSKIGMAAMLRCGGFLFATLLALWLWPLFKSIGQTPGPVTQLLMLPPLAALFYSFSLTGHISTLPALLQILLIFHVLAVFLWTGSLYPLLSLSSDTDRQKVQALMELFGKLAIALVAVLLACGIYMLTELLGSPLELVSSAYGRAMLVKLLLVITLLGLGAINKLWLVPGLQSSTGLAALQKSIRIEMCLALLVIAVTAVLTSVLGPAMHMSS